MAWGGVNATAPPPPLSPVPSKGEEVCGAFARAPKASDMLLARVSKHFEVRLAAEDAKDLELRRTQEAIQCAQVKVPDPYPLKAIPTRVLAEEDYVDAVSQIIERDFFPDLASLRVKHELMRARNSGDVQRIRQLEWKLVSLPRPTPVGSPAVDRRSSSHAGTPAATPVDQRRFAATPESPCRSGSGERHGEPPTVRPQPTNGQSAWERDDDVASTLGTSSDAGDGRVRLRLADGREVAVDLSHVRLDDFQAVFTSEDNASFEDVMKKDLEKLKRKEWWMEGSERKHNTKQLEVRQALEAGDHNKFGIVLVNDHKARNALSFKPPGLPQTMPERPRVEFKNTRFTTEKQIELEASLELAIRERKSRRYSTQHESNPFVKGTLRAIGGRFENLEPRAHTPCGQDGGEPSNVNAYSLVKTPMLLPGVDGLSPFMTYGEIGSTPLLLEEPGPTGPSFHMAESSLREMAAEKLSRSVVQKQRNSKQVSKAERFRALGLTPNGTPGASSSRRSTPGASSLRLTPGSLAGSRVTPLSPIGQLIHRAQKLARAGGVLGIRSGPEAPTPESRSGPPRKRQRHIGTAEAAFGADARVDVRSSSTSSTTLPASITDGLLK